MSKIRNIIIFVIILGGVVYAWNSFSSKENVAQDDPLSVSEGDTNALSGQSTDSYSPENVGQGFLDTLLSLRTIKLDRSVFDRDSFKQLRDFTKELVPQNNQGRPNPFAPIGTDVEITPSAGPTPVSTSSQSASVATSVSTANATTVETADATGVTRTTAILNGKLFAPTSTTVRGFEWGTNPEALTNGTPQSRQAVAGAFTRGLEGLTPNTTYYFKAIAIGGAVVSEGDIVVFTTLP